MSVTNNVPPGAHPGYGPPSENPAPSSATGGTSQAPTNFQEAAKNHELGDVYNNRQGDPAVAKQLASSMKDAYEAAAKGNPGLTFDQFASDESKETGTSAKVMEELGKLVDL